MSPFLTRKLLYWSMFLEEMSESLLCYRSPWWLGYLYFGCLYKQPEAKEGYNLMRKWRCLNYRWLLGMPQLKKNNSLSIFLFTPGLNKLTKKKLILLDRLKQVCIWWWNTDYSLYILHYIVRINYDFDCQTWNMPNKEKKIGFTQMWRSWIYFRK